MECNRLSVDGFLELQYIEPFNVVIQVLFLFGYYFLFI